MSTDVLSTDGEKQPNKRLNGVMSSASSEGATLLSELVVTVFTGLSIFTFIGVLLRPARDMKDREREFGSWRWGSKPLPISYGLGSAVGSTVN